LLRLGGVLLSLAPPGGMLLQVKVVDVEVVVVVVGAVAMIADKAAAQDDFDMAKGGGSWRDLITPGMR
jgi:NADH:ubiquinone oxidoreductase subunit 6 (subunit J)